MRMLETLNARFAAHPALHPGLEWAPVARRLAERPQALAVLEWMEQTGGEPELIGQDPDSGAYLFCDCAPESPLGRRSLCYDGEALRQRNSPGGALEQARALGLSLLSEEQYRSLQRRMEFDLKSSSWIDTPAGLRKMGGALFCQRRCGLVFTFHSRADSCCSDRGWRGLLRL